MITKVACFGAGQVGGPTMAVMAAHCPEIQFFVYDVNPSQIYCWQSGQLPVYEEGLEECIRKSIRLNLHFTSELSVALTDADIVFLAVNTPQKEYGAAKSGQLDISYIESCVRAIQKFTLTKPLIVVEKSTVPVKTSDFIKAVLKNQNIQVVSNPEFLAEGTAIRDLLNPDRVIIGGELNACQAVASIYQNWVPKERILFTSLYSAELSKIVANAFLAQRISSINSVSMICSKLGVDISEISNCVGRDNRIGAQYLQASFGFGGSCLKKDLQCLVYLARSLGLAEAADYWEMVLKLNECQVSRFCNQILESMFYSVRDKKIVILGVAFKANTNDTRDSQALTVAQALQQEDAFLRVYDPKASLPRQAKSAKTSVWQNLDGIFENATAIVILTEWDEFKNIDYGSAIKQMESPAYIFDGRNLLDGKKMRDVGFLYYGVGK